MRIIRVCALAAAGASCAAAGVIPAAALGAETASQVYSTEGEHAFVVPAAVTSVQVLAVGGHGGAGNGGAVGGLSATVTATLAVAPGETVYAEVAGNGAAATLSEERLGGFGGGGSGGEVLTLLGTVPSGGGGGGASDIRTCSIAASACESLSSRLIVAAGGGGGGGNGNFGAVPLAGGAGGSAQFPGLEGKSDGSDPIGTGGAQATANTGGAAGSGGSPSAGSPGIGGTGGDSDFLGGAGGGGGAGLFGGGGGGAGGGHTVGLEGFGSGGGGGGGGSSGVPTSAQNVSGFTPLATAPNAEPQVSFRWTRPGPTVLTGAASAVTGTSATLNGTVNPNNSQITDCHFTISPAPPSGGSIACAQQIGSGSAPVAVSASLTGLVPGTSYTYTLVAASAQGTSSGAPVTFTAFPIHGPGLGPAPALTVTGLSLSPNRFRRGGREATIARSAAHRRAKRLPTSTTISFALSQPATVTLSFQATKAGVLARGRCAAPPKRRRRARRCTRFVTVPGTVRRDAHAGTNVIRFQGVLDGGRKLALGSYQLSLTGNNAASTTTAAQHPGFTLLP